MKQVVEPRSEQEELPVEILLEDSSSSANARVDLLLRFSMFLPSESYVVKEQ